MIRQERKAEAKTKLRWLLAKQIRSYSQSINGGGIQDLGKRDQFISLKN